MAEFTIEIPGEMRGKQRARVTTRGGVGRAYTPRETVNAEAWIKSCAMDQGVIRPLDGPLRMVLTVSKGIPESWSKKRHREARAGLEMPTGRPDLDNVAKLVCDSLNGIAWRDDSQIVTMELSKRYADVPTTTVMVRQI